MSAVYIHIYIECIRKSTSWIVQCNLDIMGKESILEAPKLSLGAVVVLSWYVRFFNPLLFSIFLVGSALSGRSYRSDRLLDGHKKPPF